MNGKGKRREMNKKKNRGGEGERERDVLRTIHLSITHVRELAHAGTPANLGI